MSDPNQKIVDPCPRCGCRSLFVGAGGYLTCGNLKCEHPGVGAEIDVLKRRIEELEEIVRRQRGKIHSLYQGCRDLEAELAGDHPDGWVPDGPDEHG